VVGSASKSFHEKQGKSRMMGGGRSFLVSLIISVLIGFNCFCNFG
jgi:hypothetical protein